MSSFRRAPARTVQAHASSNAANAVVISQAPAASPNGTRRWVDGQLWTSSGHKQLDSFLGGGVPIGSMVLLEEDTFNVHASVLTSLFLAEGIACGHRIVCCSADGVARARSTVQALPLCVSRDSRGGLQGASTTPAPRGGRATDTVVPTAEVRGPAVGESSAPARTGQPDSGWDVAGDGLRIAWQYRKYIGGAQGDTTHLAPDPIASATVEHPRARQPSDPRTVTKVGHTFDLNQRIAAATVQAATCTYIGVHAGGSVVVVGDASTRGAPQHTIGSAAVPRAADEPVSATYAEAARCVRAALCAEPRADVETACPVRLAVLGLGGPMWPGFVGCSNDDSTDAASSDVLAAALPLLRFLSTLRRSVQGGGGSGGNGGDSSAVALVSAPLHLLPPALAAQVRSYFDVIIRVSALGGGLGAPQQFGDYTGLIFLGRLPRTYGGGGVGSTASAGDTRTLAFKRDRHKLVIERPHLPPEDEGAAHSAGSGPTASTPVHHSVQRLSVGACASSGGAGSSIDF